jgi:hypothetical protein
VPHVSRADLAVLARQQRGAPCREPGHDQLGGQGDGLLLVKVAGQQGAGFGKEAEPGAADPVMLGQPGPLQRQRQPVGHVLHPGQVRLGEPVRLGRRHREHPGHPALGRQRHGQQRMQWLVLDLREVGAAFGEPVVEVKEGCHPGRACGHTLVGALIAGLEQRYPAADRGAHPKLALLVGDQRIGGIGGHGFACELDGVPEQIVVPKLEQVGGSPPSPRGHGRLGGVWPGVRPWLRPGVRAGVGAEAEPDCLGRGRVRHAPRRGERRGQQQATAAWPVHDGRGARQVGYHARRMPVQD